MPKRRPYKLPPVGTVFQRTFRGKLHTMRVVNDRGNGCRRSLFVVDREGVLRHVNRAYQVGEEGQYQAIFNVLKRAGMTMQDVDVVELNEAFAAQVIPIMEKCEIPIEKLNPHGGAIALGHPFGMTGARIMCTLLNDLETADKTIGLETMCVAGGQGMAMVVERLN